MVTGIPTMGSTTFERNIIDSYLVYRLSVRLPGYYVLFKDHQDRHGQVHRQHHDSL